MCLGVHDRGVSTKTTAIPGEYRVPVQHRNQTNARAQNPKGLNTPKNLPRMAPQ